jgi:hypothetical protein
MDQVLTPQRKSVAVRGFQMLVIGVMSNIGRWKHQRLVLNGDRLLVGQ